MSLMSVVVGIVNCREYSDTRDVGKASSFRGDGNKEDFSFFDTSEFNERDCKGFLCPTEEDSLVLVEVLKHVSLAFLDCLFLISEGSNLFVEGGRPVSAVVVIGVVVMLGQIESVVLPSKIRGE